MLMFLKKVDGAKEPLTEHYLFHVLEIIPKSRANVCAVEDP